MLCEQENRAEVREIVDNIKHKTTAYPTPTNTLACEGGGGVG